MTPIKRITKNPHTLTLTLDPFAFILNTIAMGDTIAAAPVIKYLLDTYYVTPESHLVIVKKQFHAFYETFVNPNNLIDFDSTENPFWGIPDGFAVGLLNKKNDAKFVRNTPKKLHLSQYASLCYSDSLIPLDQLKYIPIKSVDVSDYNIDFTRSVVLITSYRDATREWPATEIIKLAQWITNQGLTPIFVGKTDMDQHLEKKHLIPKSALPDNASDYGVDLRNKTDLYQLASIMDQAIAVCGVDSGPIHLAGTTNTPIVCGYSTVSPEYRIPIRNAITYTIVPELECHNCESKWRTSFWNFEKCYFGHANCCTEFTAEKYIHYLKEILDNHSTN